MRKDGWNVEELDIVHGADHDITKPAAVRQMCKIIGKGRYDGALVAPPSMSLATAHASSGPSASLGVWLIAHSSRSMV